MNEFHMIIIQSEFSKDKNAILYRTKKNRNISLRDSIQKERILCMITMPFIGQG
jgi:hypothetical protein